MEATSNLVLQPDTLTGDLRDVLLTHVRAMETPWSKLSQRDQEMKISAMQKAAENLVRGAVRVVANQGFPHLTIRLGKWSVNGEMKLEVTGAGSVDNITKLAEHGAGEAILVLTEVGEYFGQRQAARAEPDQPSLGIDEEGDEDGEGDAAAGNTPAGSPADPDASAAETVTPENEREFTRVPAETAAPRRTRRPARETVEA